MQGSRERLAEDIQSLLEIVRALAQGRYACLVEPGRLLFESPREEPGLEGLKALLERRRAELFGLPARLAEDGDGEDLFAGHEQDGFLLAIVNGRVALVLACPDAEAAEARIGEPLRTLVDQLLRWEPSYGGRGFLFGSPRLDLVRIGLPQAEG